VSGSFEREIEVARRAAATAAKVIAEFARGTRKSWDKAEDSPVTQADLAANTAIVKELRDNFPSDLVLSEESVDAPERASAGRLWIVDPLDGTKEFIEGVPQYAVSIALTIDGEPVVGVVHNPMAQECFWGALGQGAYQDDRRLQISTCGALADCVMLSSRTEMRRGQVDAYKNRVKEIQPIGSVALKLAWIAAGRGDVWLSMAPKSEWDVCAGHLLVREAGGVFVTFDSGERRYNQSDILLQPPMAAGPVKLVDALRAQDPA
jgi:myo-inositol-1(or 4)-monophosphatase